jgi:hypothetical protein
MRERARLPARIFYARTATPIQMGVTLNPVQISA